MKILVIGDYISDVYTFGTATRLCPEAPVPVLSYKGIYDKSTDGGAGLVLNQLRELGASCEAAFGSWSTKHRIFAGNQLVCRLDCDTHDEMPLSFNQSSEFDPAGLGINQWDAFVVSDYSKGAMTRELARQIVETGKPCFIDAKHHWNWYEGQNSTAFPNEYEDAPNYPKVAKKLGAQGARLIESYKQFSEPLLEIRATVSEVVDVTGAGDIFMASFVYAWSIQLPVEDCLRFANELAGESCRHRGTYVVPREFAQSVLGRLRASQASGQQAPDLATYSNSPEHLRTSEPDQTQAQIIDATMNSLIANSQQELKVRQEVLDTVLASQTLPRSPLVPTGSSDTPTPSGQATQDGASGESRSAESSPSSTETARRYERRPAPHRGWLE